jgi:hypothetical protein
MTAATVVFGFQIIRILISNNKINILQGGPLLNQRRMMGGKF